MQALYFSVDTILVKMIIDWKNVTELQSQLLRCTKDAKKSENQSVSHS